MKLLRSLALFAALAVSAPAFAATKSTVTSPNAGGSLVINNIPAANGTNSVTDSGISKYVLGGVRQTTALGATSTPGDGDCGTYFTGSGITQTVATLPSSVRDGCLYAYDVGLQDIFLLFNGQVLRLPGVGGHDMSAWRLIAGKENGTAYLQFNHGRWALIACDPILCENSMPTWVPMLANGQGLLAQDGANSRFTFCRYKGPGWMAVSGYDQRLPFDCLYLAYANVPSSSSGYIYLGQTGRATIASIANNGGHPRVTFAATVGAAGAGDQQTFTLDSVGGTTDLNGVHTGVAVSGTVWDFPTVTYAAFTSGGAGRALGAYASTAAPVTGTDGVPIESGGTGLSGSEIGTFVSGVGHSITGSFSYYNGADAVTGCVKSNGDGTFQQCAAADLSDMITGSGSLVKATSPTLVTPALGTPSAINLTNATSIPAAQLTGTVPAAALPNPSASTLGGVQSKASVSHQFLNTISTSGVPGAAQPAASDLSDGTTGSGAVALATSPALVTPTVKAGATGSGTIIPEGLIHPVTASVNTTTGTGEQTLDTYNLPANSLDVVGRYLRIRYWFNTAANTDTKTAKCYFGAQVFSTATTTSAKMMACELIVFKTGSNTQNVMLGGITAASTLAWTFGAGVETDTAAITIKATCTDGTSAAADCTLVGGTVEYLN